MHLLPRQAPRIGRRSAASTESGPSSDLESPVYHTRVAKTCAKCHADEKVMAGYQYHGHPLGHEQYAEWRASVHGRALMDKGDLSAPTCNNCHGNHGAVPPAVGSVANACGTCHGKIAGLFADTRMKHRFEQERLPGCATCHSSHKIQLPSDKMVGMQRRRGLHEVPRERQVRGHPGRRRCRQRQSATDWIN